MRKLVTVVEEVVAEGGVAATPPLRKAAAMAVIANPYAGIGFVEDLSELVDPSAELGALLGERAAAALGQPVEGYGKAALVGKRRRPGARGGVHHDPLRQRLPRGHRRRGRLDQLVQQTLRHG